MSLSIAEIENNFEKIIIDFNKENFIDEFILSFGMHADYVGRTRCIFENGTESNMLWYSVKKMIYDEGRTDAKKRIQNAKKEPIYLMDDVHLVLQVASYNLNSNKFEQIIHTFFNEVYVEMEVHDNVGISHKPKEWFSVTLDVVG